MAKGRGKKLGAWDLAVEELVNGGCAFRLYRRQDSRVIYVRQYESGKVLRTISTKAFFHEDESGVCGGAEERHIKEVVRLCWLAHKKGAWDQSVGGYIGDGPLTWQAMVDDFMGKYKRNVVRDSSCADHVYLLNEMRCWAGVVCTERLRKWFNQTDPYEKPSRFKKMLQVGRDLRRYQYLDTRELVDEQKLRRPTKAQKQSLGHEGEKPRAIPSDEQLYKWLKSIDRPLHQWLFALITVYGLRPSEAWHVDGIHEGDLLVTVPSKPLCKTFKHHARPCPVGWVEEFGLQRNFEAMRRELLETYQLRWNDAGKIPLNNSRVVHSGCYQPISKGRIKKLWAKNWEGGPESEEMEWCRPYDLRHAYAVRLFTHPETNFLPIEKHAWWMGHSVQQHRDVYLKWMPEERLREAEEWSYENAKKLSQTQGQEIKRKEEGENLSELLERIERLEAVNQKQKKMIDAILGDSGD